MIDFIEAFKQGQTAAEVAKINHKEIDFVFDELNKQLHKATDGKIKIYQGNVMEVKIKNRVGIFNSTFPDKIKYQAILAINPLISNCPEEELAKWEQDKEGYPCKITLGNKQHYCEDQESLEYTLALMLQDPIVAETLSNLMRLSSENQVIA